MGKILIIIGVVLVIVGLALHFGSSAGRLPGDIVIERGNFKMFIPITTSILLSVLISLILYFVNRAK